MICSPNISLSKDELSFLRKGPRFMLRQEVEEKDFRVELEKMTMKEKFNDSENESENSSVLSDDSISEEAEKEAARSAMVYLKSEKSLDLGKIKATDYKFNKRVLLPEDGSTESEAIHEVRRSAMLDVVKKSISNNFKKKRRIM